MGTITSPPSRHDRRRAVARPALGARRSLAVAALLALIAAMLVVTGRPAAAAGASSSDAARFVQLINGERSSRGLGSLSSHSELAGIAVGHSRQMASSANGDGRCNDTDGLRHRNSISAGIDAPWTALAENVGYYCPADVGALHQALMDSHSHRVNILNGQMRYVGVGAYHDVDGGLWVTQIFMDVQQSSSGGSSSGGSGSTGGSSPSQPAPAPAPDPDPWDDVGAYQRMLRDLGYYGGAIDGVDGPGTSRAVRTFQRANGLTVDGVVGPGTWRALRDDDVVDAATWRERTRPKPEPKPDPEPKPSAEPEPAPARDPLPPIAKLTGELDPPPPSSPVTAAGQDTGPASQPGLLQRLGNLVAGAVDFLADLAG